MAAITPIERMIASNTGSTMDLFSVQLGKATEKERQQIIATLASHPIITLNLSYNGLRNSAKEFIFAHSSLLDQT